MSPENLDNPPIHVVSLTPAAEELLNQHLAARRIQIMSQLQALSEGGQIDSARASDVEIAIRRVEAYEAAIAKQETRRRILLGLKPLAMPLIVGVVLGAVTVYLASMFADDSALAVILVVTSAVGLVGVLLVIVGVVAIRRSRRKRMEALKEHDLQLLIRLMETIERRAGRLYARAVDVTNSTVSLNELLQFLVSRGLWRQSDLDTYRRLLAVRNAVVHDEVVRVEPDQLREFLREANQLAAQI